MTLEMKKSSDGGRIVTEEEDVGEEGGTRKVEGQTWQAPPLSAFLRPFVFPHHNCFFFSLFVKTEYDVSLAWLLLLILLIMCIIQCFAT